MKKIAQTLIVLIFSTTTASTSLCVKSTQQQNIAFKRSDIKIPLGYYHLYRIEFEIRKMMMGSIRV